MTTGAAATVGKAAGVVMAAPAAVMDQDTRDHYGDYLGGTGGATRRTNTAGQACVEPNAASKECAQ